MTVLMYDVKEVNDNHYYIMIEQELTQETHSFAEQFIVYST